VGIDADHCTASDGQIRHPDGQRQMTFGSIAEKAAQLSIPINVPLKAVEDFKIVGPSMSTLDGNFDLSQDQ
jgi:isoquinoline 1-oxidoreductase subunit beta